MRRDGGDLCDGWRLGLAAGAFGGFLALFEGVRLRRTDAIDLALTNRLQRCRAPWFARTLAAVSWPGFPPQSRLVPPLLAAVAALVGRRSDGLFQLAAWGIAPVGTFTKAQMRRPRPASSSVRVAQGMLDGTSFPSGHVLSYVAVYGQFALTVARSDSPVWLRWTCAAFCGGLIALVGPSRVYLGHHWSTDVAASYLLALTYLLGLRVLQRRFWEGIQGNE